MRTFLGILVFSLAAASASHPVVGGEPLRGRWEGAVVRDNAIQTLVLRIDERRGGLSGTYDIPELNLYGEPLADLRRDGAVVELRLLYGRFAGRLHEDTGEITAANGAWGPPVALHLKRVPDRAPDHREEDVRFRSGAAVLAGAVYRPVAAGPHAGVVVVHGSGSQGRGAWEYRGLGPMFARMGLAALVYDKRGTGQSTGDPEAAFAELADDAAAAVACLAGRPGVDGERVGLFGTSQGGWLAPLAASRSDGVAFLVLEKGPAVTVAEQELHRVAYTMRAEGFGEDDVTEALAYTRTMLGAADGTESWEILTALGERARGKPWAEHVQLVGSPADLAGWRRQAYDPAPVLRRTRAPVLALFGEKDTLVPPEENLERMRRYLHESGNPDVTLVVLPGEGHNRYRGQGLAGGRWAWPEAYWTWDRVSPRELSTLEAWLSARGLTPSQAAERTPGGAAPPRPARARAGAAPAPAGSPAAVAPPPAPRPGA